MHAENEVRELKDHLLNRRPYSSRTYLFLVVQLGQLDFSCAAILFTVQCLSVLVEGTVYVCSGIWGCNWT